MAPPDRSSERNIRFSDERNPDVILGGLIQNGSVTEMNFLSMLNMVLIAASPIRVYAKATGALVLQADTPLQLGDYIVACNDQIHVSNEMWLHRVISYSVSGRDDSFRNGIRARDGGCVISGVKNKSVVGNWTAFEAAYIFPLELENLWIEFNYGREFDQYLISVNPDDNYKVTVFGVDTFGMDGRFLDPACRNPEDPHRVSDQLLRWHFRQSVLANVRGAGEPIFEYDFPPGTDMMKEIREGPYAQERFEKELAVRFRETV
ncbi:MAG: hypothetical protein M1813_006442 [Trichoglossum hirsutum]|nr:MAG: hypothetical protein M1813_007454 [Trichoglossum hirsutum]KAI9859899.1 MAG: hypothetical protein M1813_006442 [Trichoglossum hirsutum]